MPTKMLTRPAPRVSDRVPEPRPPRAERPERGEFNGAMRRHAVRVRRLRLHAAAFLIGTAFVTTLWVVVEWWRNGRLASFGHEGEPGQWNPTLWALVVGLWGLAVGIMALRVVAEHPLRGRVGVGPARLVLLQRLAFHVAAWTLGLIVLTPLWALLEWQDNGALERFSSDGRPGSWDPWIVYVAGIWAVSIAIVLLRPTIARRIGVRFPRRR